MVFLFALGIAGLKSVPVRTAAEGEERNDRNDITFIRFRHGFVYLYELVLKVMGVTIRMGAKGRAPEARRSVPSRVREPSCGQA